MNTLDSLKLDDKTIIVFVSDNGGVSSGDDYATSNLPLRGGKGYQWEAGTRIPFLIKAPNIKNTVKIVNTPVMGADLFPTLLELAGLENPYNVDGKSLVPLLKDEVFGERSLYWHYPHYGNQGGDPCAIIRNGDWKLIHYFEDGKNELYNLSMDMGETNNILNQFPQQGLDLKNDLDKWLSKTYAKIPSIDPKYNEEKEIEWLLQNKQKMKLKVEKRRAFQLDINYIPNEDWWGSKID